MNMIRAMTANLLDFKRRNSDLFYLILISAVLLIFMGLFPVHYHFLRKYFMLVMVDGASFLLNLFKIPRTIDSSPIVISSGTEFFRVDQNFFSIKFIIWSVSASILLIKPNGLRKILLPSGLILLISVVNILRLFIAFASIKSHYLIINEIQISLYRVLLFLIPIVLLILKNKGHPGKIFSKTGFKSMSDIDQKVIILTFLGICLCIPGIFVLKVNWLFDSLTYLIFGVAKFILSQFSIVATYGGRLLTNDHAKVYVGDGCIGVNMMLIFSGIIFISKGKTLHKMIYSLAGISIILLLNAIRVSLLFACVLEVSSPEQVGDWHTGYNFVIYIAVFLLWMVWYHIQKLLKPQP